MPRLYETMYVVKPDLPEEEFAAVMGRAADAVMQAGGTVQLNELYEKRALAYEIDGCVRGTYCMMYFEGEGEVIEPLKRELDLDEQVLRYLIVLANPRAIWRPGVGVGPQAGAEAAEEPEEEAPEAEAEVGEAETPQEAEEPAAPEPAEEPTEVTEAAEAIEPEEPAEAAEPIAVAEPEQPTEVAEPAEAIKPEEPAEA